MSIHSRSAGCLRVRHIWFKRLWRFPVDHLPNRRKMASATPRWFHIKNLSTIWSQISGISPLLICLKHTIRFSDNFATLASMFKLEKGDDMGQLRIEVCGVSSYCMNIEECMNVEAKIDGKPWYHDIKAYIKNGEYSSEATNSEKKFIRCMACQFFLSGKVLYKRNHDKCFLWCINAP